MFILLQQLPSSMILLSSLFWFNKHWVCIMNNTLTTRDKDSIISSLSNDPISVFKSFTYIRSILGG